MNFKLITLFLISLFFLSAHCISAENPDTGDFPDYNGTVKELTVDDAKEITNETAEKLTVNDAKQITNETAEKLIDNNSLYPNNQIISNYEIQSDEYNFGDLSNIPPIIAYKINYIVSGFDEDSFNVIPTNLIDIHTFTLKIRIVDENGKSIPHCPFILAHHFNIKKLIEGLWVNVKIDYPDVELMTDATGWATFTVPYQPSPSYIENSVDGNTIFFYLYCKQNNRIWDSTTVYV